MLILEFFFLMLQNSGYIKAWDKTYGQKELLLIYEHLRKNYFVPGPVQGGVMKVNNCMLVNV